MSESKATRPAAVTRPSPLLMSFFDIYLPRYLRRHFHGFRIAHAARLTRLEGPLILYLNHASWWDPLTAWLLARRFLPGTHNYAPIDAAALQRYRILRHIGLFPVEQGSRRGAAQFLDGARQILTTPSSNLWITPQGAFTDVRTRPLVFKPGLAAVIARLPRATVIPVAIEYTYWDERLPELLVNIGEPVFFATPPSSTDAESALLAALARAQDELALLAAARDPRPFAPVLQGAAGVSGVYELWRRTLSRLRGEVYDAEHGKIREIH
jgi:1-acyl-sn-glycerol-3-phosphate acyltransferase